MSDDYSYDPPESLRAKPDWRVDAAVISVIVLLLLGSPLLAWWTGDVEWLLGWVLLLLLGLAG